MVAIMVAPAAATWTRVMTMGNQQMFIQDDYNIWQWTSTVNNYPRHLIVDHSIDAESYEFSDYTDYDGGTRLGMIVPFMKSSVLGVFVSDFDVEYGNIPGADLTPGEADSRIDLFYGYRGANWDLGVRVDYWGTSIEQDGKSSNTALGLNAGVGFNVNGNQLEINGMYKSISWKNEVVTGSPVVVNNEKDSGSDIGLAARYMIAYSSMVTLTPAFAYRSQKLAEKTQGAPNPVRNGAEAKTTGYDLGIGCNTVPLQGTEFLTSLGVRSIKHEVTDSTGTLDDFTEGHLPYISFGTEIQVKSWLALRAGAQKTWDTFKDRDVVSPTPEFKASSAEFNYNVGGSVMVGDVQFDLDLNPDWVTNGPYFLSGTSSSPMFFYASFKYDYR
jgi:hypothetical protein